MWRHIRRDVLRILRPPVVVCGLWSPISVLTVSRGVVIIFLQNGPLKLRCPSEAVEPVRFAEIWLWRRRWWLIFVNGAVFTARICGIAPLIGSMAAIRRGPYSIVGLMVIVGLVDILISLATIQGRIGVVSWPKATPASMTMRM